MAGINRGGGQRSGTNRDALKRRDRNWSDPLRLQVHTPMHSCVNKDVIGDPKSIIPWISFVLKWNVAKVHMHLFHKGD